MNDTERHFDSDPDARVSPRFAEDLGRLFAPHRPVPPDVDRAVAEAARRHLAPRPRRLWWLRWTVPATAAAAILVAATAWWFASTPTPSVPFGAEAPKAEGLAQASLVQADIDENGTVDILDAFTLARHIEAEHPSETRWDLNADGLVDRRDVDVVALAAVRLNKGV